MSGPQLDIDSIEARAETLAKLNATILSASSTQAGVVRIQLAADVPALCREVRQLRQALAAVEKLCAEYGANCDPTSVQAQVAEHFRAALNAPSHQRDKR